MTDMTIREATKAAMEKWAAANPPDEIEQHVMDALDAARKSVIDAMLGINDRWGRIEIHSSKGLIPKTLADHTADRVKQWASDALDGIEIPSHLIETAREQFKENFRDELHYHLRKLAEEKAEAAARQIVEEEITPELLDKLRIDFNHPDEDNDDDGW